MTTKKMKKAGKARTSKTGASKTHKTHKTHKSYKKRSGGSGILATAAVPFGLLALQRIMKSDKKRGHTKSKHKHSRV